MNIQRLRSSALALMAILALLPGLVIAQQGHSPIQATPAASPVAEPATEWSVDRIGVVSVDGSPVTMSPDGASVAGIGPEKQLCVWNLPALEPTCEEPSGRNINPDSIVWSPDGTAIAFTLDVFLRGEESDLFVYEIETGVSANLTDDGVEGSLFSGGDNDATMLVDVMPAWTHDSQSLIFVRSDFTLEEPGTHLMSISRAGGEPVLLETVSDFPFAIFTQMHLLDDDSLLFALGPGDLDDPDTGIWLLASDGELTQVMSAPAGSDFSLPVVTDVHERDGAVRVAAYSYAGLTQGRGTAPFAFILDLGTGDVLPLESDDPFRQIGPTIFSPDGAAMFSVTPGGGVDSLIIIHDGEQTMMELGVGDESTSTPVRLNRGLEWRGEGVLFIPNAVVRDPYVVILDA